MRNIIIGALAALLAACSGGDDTLTISDVALPQPEVAGAGKWIVFAGPDFRFQAEPDFVVTEGDTGYAAEGTMKADFGDAANVSVFVTRESHSGSLQEYLDAARSAVTDEGGEIAQDQAMSIHYAGVHQTGVAHRFRSKIGDTYELRTYVKHEDEVLVQHCRVEPANIKTWLSAGSFCAISSASFHVAPPE